MSTATHDGTHLRSSTKTVTEWTFRSTGHGRRLHRAALPMIQAYYDVDADAAGRSEPGRKAGKPIALGLELGHVAGADRQAEITDATLEMRVAGGEWKAVELERMPRPTRPRRAR